MRNPQRVTTEELQRLYLASPADSEALLNALLSRAQDAVRQRLANRGVAGEDLEDCHAETMARLVQAAQRGRIEPQRPIENYSAYALKIADRVFHDYMRARRPNWRRLKRQILYLLKGKSGSPLFQLWQQRLDWLGGFARWRGRPFQPTPRYHALQENAERFRKQALENRGPEQVPLPELLALLFRYIETPLELDELTGHIAALRQLREPEVLSLHGAEFAGEESVLARRMESADMEGRVTNALANETFQANLWRIICDLPLAQRAGFAAVYGPRNAAAAGDRRACCGRAGNPVSRVCCAVGAAAIARCRDCRPPRTDRKTNPESARKRARAHPASSKETGGRCMRCLTPDILESYRRGKLQPPQAVQQAERHLLSCGACRALLRAESADAAPRLAQALLPTPEDADCPDDEAMIRYVDGAMDEMERERFAAHLEDCKLCRDDVEDLQRFQEKMQGYDWRKTRPPRFRERLADDFYAACHVLRARGAKSLDKVERPFAVAAAADRPAAGADGGRGNEEAGGGAAAGKFRRGESALPPLRCR